MVSFVHSTAAQNVAALRIAFQQLSGERACRVARYILGLTDAQIKNAFNINQTQCNALRVRLQARVDTLTAMQAQAGE